MRLLSSSPGQAGVRGASGGQRLPLAHELADMRDQAFDELALVGLAAPLLAEGRQVREIAAMAGWKEGYVRRLLKRIYKKVGVSGQVSLVPRVLAVGALPRK